MNYKTFLLRHPFLGSYFIATAAMVPSFLVFAGLFLEIDPAHFWARWLRCVWLFLAGVAPIAAFGGLYEARRRQRGERIRSGQAPGTNHSEQR